MYKESRDAAMQFTAFFGIVQKSFMLLPGLYGIPFCPSLKWFLQQDK